MPSSKRSQPVSPPSSVAPPSPSTEIAILSDIHSNLQALEAVLAECVCRKITHFCCLGDIVGYGANPSECLKRIRSIGCPTVLGNHDLYVASGQWGESLNDIAQAGVEYSISRLDNADRAWLGKLPAIYSESTFTLVHASLQAPHEWEYILSKEQARPTLTLQKTPLCFYGHTHRPKLFARGEVPPKMLKEGKFSLRPDERYLVNPGSVGQPRGEGDPRAQFAIFDRANFTIEFVRTSYDVAGAAKAIRDAGLPSYLADRLIAGM